MAALGIENAVDLPTAEDLLADLIPGRAALEPRDFVVPVGDGAMGTVEDGAGILGAVVVVVLGNLRARIGDVAHTQAFVVVGEVATKRIIAAKEQAVRETLVETNKAGIVEAVGGGFDGGTRAPQRIAAAGRKRIDGGGYTGEPVNQVGVIGLPHL